MESKAWVEHAGRLISSKAAQVRGRVQREDGGIEACRHRSARGNDAAQQRHANAADNGSQHPPRCSRGEGEPKRSGEAYHDKGDRADANLHPRARRIPWENLQLRAEANRIA